MKASVRAVLACAVAVAACGDSEPAETDAAAPDTAWPDAAAPEPRPDATPGQYSVVSNDGILHPPAPACTGGQWIDFGCDSNIPLGCSDSGRRIDFSPDDDSPCPICVWPAPSDPNTCQGWKLRYGLFLADIVSASCANWCDTVSDCFAWQITNACGTYAMSLFGGIDEEPILFAEEFAADNCGVCGEREQVESREGPLLEAYESACIDHQCVLVRREDGSGAPDAAP